MTAAYYDQEKTPAAFEEQVLSIETALQAADPATAQQLLDDAQAWLGQMWQQAQTAGDQSSLTAIQVAWDNMNAIKVQADTALDVAHGAVAGMKAVIEQRDQVAGELAELTNAIDEVINGGGLDAVSHSLISELAEFIEEDEGELYERINDSVRDDIARAIQRSTKLNLHSAYNLFDTLTSRGRVLSNGQLDELIEHLQTCKDDPDSENEYLEEEFEGDPED